VLVARRENEIGHTTAVSSRPEFGDRVTTRVVDGRKVTGWFTEDLTLRAQDPARRERLQPNGYRRGADPAAIGDSSEETQAFLDAGVDFLFTDHPDTTLEARRLHTSGIRTHAAT
jgi:glycerophosphoryl diester phosphodiesterase